ncbi:MAG: copper resistance protein B [Deltaproteobacteria bacterium]|nr:copper resistance protein B [Deltaproteobacteria bacterium]MBW2130930.1 copper resistance protein B [Deltaproteobacteria bacterium]
MNFAFQDVAERRLGAGLTDVALGLRLRYEIKREFAPYIGVRYQSLVGETDNIAEADGEDTKQLFWLTGLRVRF